MMQVFDDEVNFRNYQVVVLTQALLGAIPPNVDMIVLSGSGLKWTVHLFVDPDSDFDPEVVDNILTDCVSVQSLNMDFFCEIIDRVDCGSDVIYPDIVVYKRFRERAGN